MSRLPRPAVLIAAVGQAAAGVLLWRFGPHGPIPMHFSVGGTIDRYGDRSEAALLVGGMALLTLAGGAALGWSGRRREADDARRRGLGVAQGVLIAATSAIVTLQLAMATLGTDGTISPQRLSLIGICTILTVIGAAIGKVAPNALVGVRTPWSLNSRLAWEKSNRLAGRLFFWGGLVGLVVAPALPEPQGHGLVIAGVLLAAAVCVFESWRVWRSDPQRRIV
ncbi:MAG TPA: SdpI family protein [Caulobacter sp.]|nr:SdpI family protein [Caulobacter sp.]